MADLRLVHDGTPKRDWTKGRGPADTGGHEPPGGDGVEARVAKLESHFEYIRRDLDDVKSDVRDIKKDMREDFRIMFGALVVVALGLAGMMAKGFGWL
ncbi:hypothetical protein [Stutzerimonas nitrititolerans]|uniref:hypothetical protein n=1 Tax=Stutzerimonas nitrititolerans TaxID=2482751 RepID=UPI00289DA626|nr:hypothetical protein [Stutzerimonas nitrititolerans]